MSGDSRRVSAPQARLRELQGRKLSILKCEGRRATCFCGNNVLRLRARCGRRHNKEWPSALLQVLSVTALARDASPSVKPPVAASGLRSQGCSQGQDRPPEGPWTRAAPLAPGSVVPSAFAAPGGVTWRGSSRGGPWAASLTGRMSSSLSEGLRLKSVPFPCRPRLVHPSAEGHLGGVSL